MWPAKQLTRTATKRSPSALGSSARHGRHDPDDRYLHLSATGEQWVPFTSRQRVITRSGRGCLPRWPASLVEPLAGPGLLLSGRLHGSGSNCPCGAGWCVDALACAAFLLHGDRAEPPVDRFYALRAMASSVLLPGSLIAPKAATCGRFNWWSAFWCSRPCCLAATLHRRIGDSVAEVRSIASQGLESQPNALIISTRWS